MSSTPSLSLSLALGVLAGASLGGVFFAGLWWTVRRGVSSAAPALWFLPSLLLRTAVVVCGFYAVGRDDWRRLAACVIGFLIARSVGTRLSREPRDVVVGP